MNTKAEGFEGAAETAQFSIDILAPPQQDLLGLVTLGLVNDEIASRIAYSATTVKSRLTQAYDLLGIEGVLAERRTKARDLGWTVGLLERVHSDDTKQFPLTQSVIDEQFLGLDEVRLMGVLKLTLNDYRVLQLMVRGLTYQQIGEKQYRSTETITSQLESIRTRTGTNTAQLKSAIASIGILGLEADESGLAA